jgi:hypothetical protein
MKEKIDILIVNVMVSGACAIFPAILAMLVFRTGTASIIAGIITFVGVFGFLSFLQGRRTYE